MFAQRYSLARRRRCRSRRRRFCFSWLFVCVSREMWLREYSIVDSFVATPHIPFAQTRMDPLGAVGLLPE